MGSILRKLRKEKGMSQQKCADEIGISLRTLQRYEKGKYGYAEYLIKIAEYFEVSFDDIKKDSSSISEK